MLVNSKVVGKQEAGKYIDRFEELIKTLETDMGEAYRYFFLTLSDAYKEDLIKFLEGEVPEDIHNAYKRVHTLNVA